MSAIVLGCMVMNDFYGGRNETEALKTIQYALDHGVTLPDTANMYGSQTNELLVGKAAKGRRRLDEVMPQGNAAGDRYPDMSTVNR